MNVATAWLATLMITLFVWGGTFGIMWGSATKSRLKRIGAVGTIVVLVLGFFAAIGLIWFTTITGIYVGAKS